MVPGSRGKYLLSTVLTNSLAGGIGGGWGGLHPVLSGRAALEDAGPTNVTRAVARNATTARLYMRCLLGSVSDRCCAGRDERTMSSATERPREPVSASPS